MSDELQRIGKKVDQMSYTLYGDGNGNPGLVKRFEIVDKFYGDWQAVEIEKQKQAQNADREQTRRERKFNRWMAIVMLLLALLGAWFGWLEFRHKFNEAIVPNTNIRDSTNER